MSTPDAAEALRHPALEKPSGACGSVGEVDLTDRQRLGVLLQAAALLAHLEHGGWSLLNGWEGAVVDRDGVLRLPEIVPGRGPKLPQELLGELLRLLFRVRDGIAGRGEGRRAARALLAGWDQVLAPLPPELAVEQILDTAPFLWEPTFAAARRALVAEHRRDGGWSLWLVGPGRWRQRHLALASDRRELEGLVTGEVGRELWEGLGRNGSRATGADPPSAPLAAAERCFDSGAFEQALDLIHTLSSRRAAVLRAWCHYYLGQLGAARVALRSLRAISAEQPEGVSAAEAAVRILTASGDVEGARRWVERVVAGVPEVGPARLRAEVLAATAAWDRGDLEAMDHHLEAARGALDTPALAWRWHHAAALREQAAADGAAAMEHLAQALTRDRRGLTRFEAAGLWNDLGVARAQVADLAGAERAFLHSLRLYQRCDGPRKITLALQNLAEIRLRRGRVHGVRQILEQATATNRQAGNPRAMIYDLALWARFELVHGRPEAALALCREALAAMERHRIDTYRPQIQVLAARALGWLGRGEQAADALAETTPEALAELEPEERAPLWAHAGERERALREASAGGSQVTAALWRGLLTAAAAPMEAWEDLEKLEPFRAARTVFDSELLVPGAAPIHWLRRAVAVFRRLGAGLLAERLETREGGPWQALETYLGKLPGQEALQALFAQAGYSEVRLWWECEDRLPTLLIEGPVGSEELAAPLGAGRLVLTAPWIDGPLRVLFRLALRDFVPEEAPARRPPAGGMVGESPALLHSLERLERLAASELSVLILGESGTGKELAARWIHRRSRRCEGTFVPVNCAALTETLLLSDLFGHVRGSFTGADRDRAGVFETAQGGIVFLDEIGDIPPVAQGMLLRVLQEGEVRRVGESLPRRVDVRLVAATHRDLAQMVRGGSFREDLFYRLRGASVTLPPLRDRGRDVLLLANHILERLSIARPVGASAAGRGPLRLSSAARKRLLAHTWPGNIRELENVLGTAAALAADGSIELEHLDLPAQAEAPGSDYHAQVDAFRRNLVQAALDEAGGSRAQAARRLGLTRQALSYLVKSLGLEV